MGKQGSEIDNENVLTIDRPGEKYNDRICGLFYKKMSTI